MEQVLQEKDLKQVEVRVLVVTAKVPGAVWVEDAVQVEEEDLTVNIASIRSYVRIYQYA